MVEAILPIKRRAEAVLLDAVFTAISPLALHGVEFGLRFGERTFEKIG